MSAYPTVAVVLAKHEREAMHQLVLVARSVANVVASDNKTSARLLVQAQAVEDVLTRLDTARQNAGSASPTSNASKE